MRFLGNVLATIVGIFIFCMIFFFGIIIIGAIAGSGDETVSVKKNSVIELDLSKVSLDYAGKTNYKDFNYFEAHHDGVTDILNAIEAAKTDDKIKGISILNNQSQLGLAQSKAVRDKLEEFKKSGKFVYAYANYYTQGEYYLNSVADQIYLNPMGEVDLKGLSAEIIYMKDLQEKTGVKMEVIRHGKYKSAVEPFLAQEMSPENREQMTVLLNSVWNTIVADIAKSRKLSIAQLNAIANTLGARTPELALANKLVDKVAYEDEYHDMIRAKLKLDKKEKYDSLLSGLENVLSVVNNNRNELSGIEEGETEETVQNNSEDSDSTDTDNNE